MKKLLLAITLLVGTAGLNAAAPWSQPGKNAFQLPGKDKEKLQIILNAAGTATPSTGAASNLGASISALGYKTAVTDLKAQIDRVKLSLSGMISSLSWRERLEALKVSLGYIKSIQQRSISPSIKADIEALENQINQKLRS